MSMPSFPKDGADITRDQALNMIIASIAMEELALSHILNAEGEKLQFILGTLPDGRKPCASPQEILEVNKSVSRLLDTVLQNQMLLKGKLERVLEAGGHAPPPKPSCPPCGEHCREKPLVCCKKSCMQLIGQCRDFLWKNGCFIPWKCREVQGSHIEWHASAPTSVQLRPGKGYLVSYTINVRGDFRMPNNGAVFLKVASGDGSSEPMPLFFSVDRCPERGPLTLQYATLLFPKESREARSSFSLLLNSQEALCVEQAALNILEV